MHRKQLESIPREMGTKGKRTVIKMRDLKTAQLFLKGYILHTGRRRLSGVSHEIMIG